MADRHLSFTDLEVWKKARALKNDIRRLIAKFPEGEKFRLADQMIRSVRSIAANIAEGHGRFSYKDQLHFCIQARGSLSETLNHLYDALDCDYITQEEFEINKVKVDELERLLNGYISFLRKHL